MWKAVYISERGTAHIEDGTPCQDFCRVRTVNGAGGPFLIAACADGAGSACHAHIGADLACWSFTDHLSNVVNAGQLHEGVVREDAVEWCETIRKVLIERAERLQVPLREFACTLLGAVVGESNGVFLQIGDGAMVVSEGDDCEPIFWPQSGDYANTTNFLTDSNYEESLDFCVRPGRIKKFAAFTDGLERLILRFADRTVHSPALLPMLDAIRHDGPPAPPLRSSALVLKQDAVRRDDDEKPYFALLRRFLQSERVNERTNDDKTLILAVQVEDGRDGEEKVS